MFRIHSQVQLQLFPGPGSRPTYIYTSNDSHSLRSYYTHLQQPLAWSFAIMAKQTYLAMLNLILFLFTLQFHQTVTIPSRSYLSKRWNFFDCDREDNELLQASLNDVIEMGKYAKAAIEGLQNNRPISGRADPNKKLRINEALEAWFGEGVMDDEEDLEKLKGI